MFFLRQLIIAVQYSYKQQEDNYFDIRQTKKLYFYRNQLTTNKHQIPRKQMEPQNSIYEPEMIVCTNKNVKSNQPIWVCQTNEPNIEIHDYVINCEGKRGDNDFYVLEDSCSIEYNIVFKNQKGRNESKYNKYASVFDLFDEFFDNGIFRQNVKELKPIRLNDISFLVFNRDKYTTSRKNDIYPQLYPLPGNNYQPQKISCRNIGFDGEKPVWQCKADIPYPYKLQEATVSCEGWNQPGDEYIVPGSCMIKYKITKINNQQKQRSQDYGYDYGFFLELIVWMVMISIILFISFKKIKGGKRRNIPRFAQYIHYQKQPERVVIINQPMNKKEDYDEKQDRQQTVAETEIRNSEEVIVNKDGQQIRQETRQVYKKVENKNVNSGDENNKDETESQKKKRQQTIADTETR